MGAYIGQYALELRRYGYAGTIISFEPLSVAYERLSTAAADDPDWTCCRLALGHVEREARIEIASNLASSSLLPPLNALREAAPEVVMVDSETVPVRSLDSLGLQLEVPTLMKLDVQGYEDRVVEGARSSLAAIALVECEVSIQPLYKSQLRLTEMLDLFDELGYELLALDPNLRNSEGTILQFDATLVRRDM